MLSRITHKGNQKGFTLVELMIVVAVIGITSVAGTYQIVNTLSRNRLKAAARDLYGAIQECRLNAIKESVDWRININVAANTYQMVSSGPDSTFGTADDPAVPPATNLANYGSGVTLAPQNGPCGNATLTWNNLAITQQATIWFNSRGLINGAFGSTYITNQDNAMCYAITTNLAGGLKFRQYSGTTPFNPSNWNM